MAKFVIGSQTPLEFRRCQINYSNAEFSEGKKKAFDLSKNSMTLNPAENLYQQNFYQGEPKMIIAGSQSNNYQFQKPSYSTILGLSKDQSIDKFGLTKCQLSNFQKQIVDPLKIGILSEHDRSWILPYDKKQGRYITSANPNGKNEKEMKFKRSLQVKTEQEEQNTNMNFFAYLQ